MYNVAIGKPSFEQNTTEYMITFIMYLSVPIVLHNTIFVYKHKAISFISCTEHTTLALGSLVFILNNINHVCKEM